MHPDNEPLLHNCQVIIIAFTFVVFALNHLEPPYQELLVSLLWNTPNEQQQFGALWSFFYEIPHSHR